MTSHDTQQRSNPAMPETELTSIPVNRLVPHPQNPRLQLREDVVTQIAAEIARSGFGQEHALLVQPLYVPKLDEPSQYRIISGHHRHAAALRAGISELPCWVREMSSHEALMQLVLANSQGELYPLEIGMHALSAVPLGKRGRGNSGDGLTGYAKDIGRSPQSISNLRSAAEVAQEILQTSVDFNVSGLIERSSHLYEISRAPRESWPFLVDRLTAKGWSVAETASQAEKIRKFDIPAEYAYWLPYTQVVETYLRADRLNPATVTRLIATAEGVFAYIDAEGTPEDHDTFTAWLRDHAGKESWDVKNIGRWHSAFIREIAERRAAEAEAAAEDQPLLPDGVDLRRGDFREVLKDLDGTVDAIITDPPYPAEFLPLFGIRDGHDSDGLRDFQEEGLAEIAGRLLKPGGICAVMVGQSYLPEIIERLTDNGALNYHWTLPYWTPGGQANQIWDRKCNSSAKLILLYTKGKYAGDWFGDFIRSDVNDNDKEHHHWGQSESGMADWIEHLTKPGQLICDPFLGGGTTAVVAHALSRRFVGCDIDETCITTTEARFTTTDGAGAVA